MNFGAAIKMCRVRKNLKQSDVAELAGISTSYLSLIEQDKRDLNLSTLNAIASALEVPLSILAFLASEPKENKEISEELAEKLSLLALNLISNGENGSI